MIITPLIQIHVDQHGKSTNSNTKGCPGACYFHGSPLTDKEDCKCQAYDDLDQHFDDLPDGGRSHILMSLTVTTISTDDADKQNTRCYGIDTGSSFRTIQKVGQLLRKQEHDASGNKANYKERPPGNRKRTTDLHIVTLFMRLRHHSRHRYRKSCSGHGEKHIVD